MKSLNMILFALISALTVLVAGCAGNNAANAATPPPAKTASVAAAPTAARAATPAARSTFTIDAASRDPFYPRARQVATATGSSGGATTAVQNVADVPALLKEGLQGIGGTTGKRIAVINNVILETGRSAEISIAQNRRVKVRCREITRDSVMLDVEGYGPIIVSRKQML
jgi:hypothetical protein